MDACHRTSDVQEHKIFWHAGPEQDTTFYLRVTACREQGSHCHDEGLAWVASRGQWTSYSNSFVSKKQYDTCDDYGTGCLLLTKLTNSCSLVMSEFGHVWLIFWL